MKDYLHIAHSLNCINSSETTIHDNDLNLWFYLICLDYGLSLTPTRSISWFDLSLSVTHYSRLCLRISIQIFHRMHFNIDRRVASIYRQIIIHSHPGVVVRAILDSSVSNFYVATQNGSLQRKVKEKEVKLRQER